jgi:hypothetical protein
MPMLLIRDAQMAVLTAALDAEFQKEMAVHLHSRFGEAAAELGESRIRDFVSEALTHARALGIRGRGALVLYLELAFDHGPNLADDPHNPWMRNYLVDPGVSDATERLQRLQAALGVRKANAARAAEARRNFAAPVS